MWSVSLSSPGGSMPESNPVILFGQNGIELVDPYVATAENPNLTRRHSSALTHKERGFNPSAAVDQN